MLCKYAKYHMYVENSLFINCVVLCFHLTHFGRMLLLASVLLQVCEKLHNTVDRKNKPTLLYEKQTHLCLNIL